MNSETGVKPFPIVGIGASAGGLEAFTDLLKALPVNMGMGFVLIQHLDPTHASVLTDLLSKTTKMQVTEVKNDVQVEQDHVYVIAPNTDLTIANGVLRVTPRSKTGELHLPVDMFLRSLADDQKENAIGIILSGTAKDGTLGLKAVLDNGGITFAQDRTAKYQGMPKAAIDSGCVDYVLPPDGIAEKLSQKSHHLNIRDNITPIEQELLFDQENELRKIFIILYKSTGVDFSHYKKATINRRIIRRMHMHKFSSPADYIVYLKENSGEADKLCQDILINVTSFFRDLPSFQFLKDTVFPRIVKNRLVNEPIRVWAPGCATGEEAYSLAIVLSEFLVNNSLDIPVQIFGTDVNEETIKKARRGMYSKNDLKDVADARVERYFIKIDSNYQIVKSIRDLCVFAPHNVFTDPPFAKLDLISCRNLLIYVDSFLQEKLFRTFYYSLRPEGFLMLGKSESAGTYPKLFFQIDKRYKIYAKKIVMSRGNINVIPGLGRRQITYPIKKTVKKEEVKYGFDVQKEADNMLLSRYVPASVLIDNNLEILQFRGSTGAFLEHSTGKASFNLIKMARAGLGFELRNVISKVRKSGEPLKKDSIPVNSDGIKRVVSIEVAPIKTAGEESYYLVIFEDTTALAKESGGSHHSGDGTKDKRITGLEQELAQAREDMRSVTEEQEATNEELQSANEEILSSNEELQSINEELETSKEELESTNEELTSVNEELQNLNEELNEARNYAQAIIRTVQVPLLVLDKGLRVKTANRSFLRMFQVSEEETVGNLVYDLGNGQWNIQVLRKLLNEILPKNNAFDNYEIDHIFPAIGHKIMLLNARRFYKDGDNILLAIEDITDRKDIEMQKDTFIGIASHELKTPITTMKGYSQILEKSLLKQGNSKDKYLIQNINKQTDRLTELINDLLNTNKIQAGKLKFQKEGFDLNTLVAKIILDFQHSTETHQFVKEGEINRQVYGDPGRVEQVLANLLTNAIKYSPKANKVIIRIESDKTNAIVSVQDFGIGVAKRDQAKIFERFYRTNEKDGLKLGGFGLGLYIASEIIKGHNGKIWVESVKGKGSKFYFTLPIYFP